MNSHTLERRSCYATRWRAAWRSVLTGNDFPTLATWLQPTSSSPSDGADYRLKTTSLSKAVGSDGKDLGVDFSGAQRSVDRNGARRRSATPTATSASAARLRHRPRPAERRHHRNRGRAARHGAVRELRHRRQRRRLPRQPPRATRAAPIETNNVDIQTTNDVWRWPITFAYVAAGEWLEYASRSPRPAPTPSTSGCRSKLAGGDFHVEVDGVNATGTITVPITGAWTTWIDDHEDRRLAVGGAARLQRS